MTQHFVKKLNKVKDIVLTKKGLVVISLVVPGGIFLASAVVLYRLYKALES